ncbi:FAD-dependent oxidoreductase [Halieaceae bacterium IMCC14734]|uniref:FAD-dependent oxidoreductase n=1 Tax=Candidatus Litorirhabdus singularis TaxID=2518993 RepID=A0ABT3TEQ6_9GAMM|nr:FAD-dependent oxidoreductase [Candidatus Litorirhabdus singularis]MCX2980781.1 FAD-dependent oxidoreductase [Candidatus Litorirhabdus singularis]
MTNTTTTDVLIIGAGAAGLTAALAAHDGGAKVTVIEKGGKLGGTAAISGGIVWVPDNPQMKAKGIDDNRDDALAYFRSLDHGEMNTETLEAFVDQGSNALEFLNTQDALELHILDGYPDYYLDHPGAKTGGGRALDNALFDFTALGDWADKIYNGGDVMRMMLIETPLGGGSGIVEQEEMQRRIDGDLRGWGQALIGRLLKACLDRDIDVLLQTRARKLISEEGRITGVTVTKGGVDQTINAQRGVILATGGFEWDEELKTTFLRGPLTAPASPPTNTGDGLKMALSAGAGLGNMTSAWWMPTLSMSGARWPDNGAPQKDAQRSMPVLIERTLPHSLMVNRQGKRFCNEANNYSALAGAFQSFDPATYDYHNLPAYLIMDSQYLGRYPIASVMPGDPLPDWIVQAADLPSLARALEVDAEQLQATVSAFNMHAESATDPEFGRGESAYDRFYGDRSRPGAAATLGPVEVGPFYAVEINMGALGTNGGARTNGMAQVLDVYGEVISGLYGAGNVISNPTGSVYAGAGGTLGPALTFGYIAGKSAAQLGNA